MDSLDVPAVYLDPEGLTREIKSLNDQWEKFILPLGLRQE
jgi:hypothetical protein